ncbi:MAG: alpha-glucosidase [Saprospiraceae bacterium]|nr:alpha-glucosidase [Saprospiraceae bacterium]
MSDKKWWKEGVMYQIYPRSFQDSNRDGIGDISGIIQRLDYLESLGIDIVWLGPVYESPNDDNGYDISNYYRIHPEFGTMEDLEELLEGLHDRGMKLIMDLVVNHSSDEHKWFQESRKSKDNSYRDFYHWRPPAADGGPPYNWKAFFGGDAWEYDDLTGEYYLHLFTKKQPDLNWENPKLREEIYKMMRFWLDKGVDGFRMDVISLISKPEEFENIPNDNLMYAVYNVYANGPRVHQYLQEMNRKVLSKYDIMTVGEGPGISKEIANDYIGKDRNELNMIFQLDLMFLDNGAGGKFDPREITLKEFKSLFVDWDKALGDDGWNNVFLDNHDFPRMVSRWGNDGEHREASAKLLLMFLLTMRGTPCIYMGSEIGMTNVAFDDPDDYRDIETVNYFRNTKAFGGDMNHAMKMVHVQGRDNVRVPMQWDNRINAGFTDGEPWIKINPNYEDINVMSEEEKERSILEFFRILIQWRKRDEVLQYGSYKDLDPDHSKLFLYKRELNGKERWVCLNFSDEESDIPREIKGKRIILNNYREIGDLLKPWQAVLLK